MDFTNLATVEFVGAIEAQRALDRRKREWLMQWRDLRRAAEARSRAAARAERDVARAARAA